MLPCLLHCIALYINALCGYYFFLIVVNVVLKRKRLWSNDLTKFKGKLIGETETLKSAKPKIELPKTYQELMNIFFPEELFELLQAEMENLRTWRRVNLIRETNLRGVCGKSKNNSTISESPRITGLEASAHCHPGLWGCT